MNTGAYFTLEPAMPASSAFTPRVKTATGLRKRNPYSEILTSPHKNAAIYLKEFRAPETHVLMNGRQQVGNPMANIKSPCR